MAPRRGFLIAALLACSLAASAAEAIECTQDKSIYEDQDKAYELRFAPVESDASYASHTFKVAIVKTGLVLDGYVMPTEDVSRSSGIIMNNCPTGDATGMELEACTVWEGVLYAIDGKGVVSNLPEPKAAAASQILLPDFGRSIRSSALWGEGKATVAPWDVLALKGCGQ